jgi:hypothetical protein
MYFEQAAPSSTRSFEMVFFETPVMRTMERMEHPSTMAVTTWARLASGSLFILLLLHSGKHCVK